MKMIHELGFKKINVLLKTIFVVCLMLTSGNVFAQYPPPPPPPVIIESAPPAFGPRLHLGLEITPSIAWLKAEDPLPPSLDGNGSKAGFGFGLIADINFSRNYAFSTGIDINYRGGNLKSLSKTGVAGSPGDSLNTVTSWDYTLEYIEIPLTLKMKTYEIGYITYFGQIGVAPGINISSKADINTQTQTVNASGAPTTATTTTTVSGADASSIINTFNMSLIISVGAEYSLGGSTKAVVAITFNNGFLNVLNMNANGSSAKAISNDLGLMLGIMF